MLGCGVDDNPCQLTRHTTPLSTRRGVGGEALLLSLFGEGLGVRPVVVGGEALKI
mgnify:CR=1 FL=1